MAEQSIVAVYPNMAQAEDAVRRLQAGGFPLGQVAIVARGLESEREIHGYVTAGDVARQGAGAGAWAGGLFGLLVGAAFLWVPGVAPPLVAGPLAAALLGGLEGAAFGATGGGLLGALAGWGVAREHTLKYEETLQAGKYLVVAHGGPTEVGQATTILEATGAESLRAHADVPAAAQSAGHTAPAAGQA